MSGENGGSSSSGIMWFFRDKGFDDQSIQKMVKKCKQLQNSPTDLASENWSYLKSIGIHERKLPHIVSRCPKILTFRLHERVQCLSTLGTKPRDVASAITKFPHVLSHGVEERLCPLLAFFQALGVPEKHLGKMLLSNPRLISYSIDTKLADMVSFLSSLGLSRDDGIIGRVVMKNPFFMGYSVEKRLRPTIDFLRSVVGLREEGVQTVVMNFPEVVCRDSDKILRPNFEYLKRCGFGNADIATMVTGYPPILIKSIKNSLEPRIKFLVDKMGRRIEEAVDYPEYFRHGLKKRVESRYKLLKQKNIACSLSEMLDCNTNKFHQRFGFSEGVA